MIIKNILKLIYEFLKHIDSFLYDVYKNWYKSIKYTIMWEYGLGFWISKIDFIDSIFIAILTSVSCKFIFDWFDKLAEKK